MLGKTIYFQQDPYPRGQDHNQPITNHCDQPWRTLNIDLRGDCYLCMCEAHLPYCVGNILDFDSLDQVWQNPTARIIQETIVNKSYTYCAVQHCGILNHNNTMSRYHIGINIDESCNLACPSCRREIINHVSGPVVDAKLQMVNHTVDLIAKFEHELTISVCGSGDPLASAILRPVFTRYQPKPQHRLKLQTNGLLIKKVLAPSPVWPYISEFNISVDAATAQVYETVRRPGKFHILQANLAWLSANKLPGTQVTLMFVVSAANISDIVPFADFSNSLGFKAEYTKLDNWSTFDNFDKQDVVGNTEHPQHQLMLDQIRQIADRPDVRIQSYIRDLI